MTARNLFDNAAKTYLRLVSNNMASINVSGQTLSTLRYEITANGFKVLGAEYVPVIEYGRGPGGFPPLRRIEDWLTAKNLDIKMAFPIAKKIAVKGTALFRGEDPRYPGKKQSGVLTEPIKPMTKMLTDGLGMIIAKDVSVQIRDIFKK